MPISLLEQSKLSQIKKYITGAGILFITFVIPVTIIQYYHINLFTTTAQSITPTPSTIVSVTPGFNSPSNILSNIHIPQQMSIDAYIIIGVLMLGLVLLQISLIFLYFRSKKYSSS